MVIPPRAGSRCASCPTTAPAGCACRTTGDQHPDVARLAGHRQQVVVGHGLHPLRPRQFLEVPAERARGDAARGRRGTSATSSRENPLLARLYACSGPRITKNSPWLIGALFMPSDAIADAILSRIELRVAVLLHVVHVVRALTTVHGHRAGRVDAAAGGVPLPRRRARGARPGAERVLRRLPVRSRRRPIRDGRRPRGGTSSRTTRPTVALARLPGPNAPTPLANPAVVAISPCTSTSGATGWVVALTPRRFVSGRASARILAEDHRERRGWAPGGAPR